MPASKKKPKSAAKKRKSRTDRLVEEISGIQGEIGVVVHALQEKVHQFEALAEFSSILNSSLRTDHVRERALEATCKLLQCETASLFLVDAEKNELFWETALGDVGKELQRSVRLKIDDRSIAGYVALHGKSLLTNDVANDPRHFLKGAKAAEPAPAGGFRSVTMICVPLISRGKVIGVLQAINKLSVVGRARPALSPVSPPVFSDDDQRLCEALSHQVSIAVENAQLYEQLRGSFYDTVEALAEAIEKKDRYTGGHTKRVVFYSMAIAAHLPLTDEQRERIRLGAILHDVGKIGIEDRILKKPAPLDDTEWPIMKTHPELGYQIMKKVDGLKDVIAGMRLHHERWDGKGYPLGLKGEEIPLIARIISVADTYDAMVSTRPYRKGLDPKIAYDEITKYAGTQFCPTVCEAFVKAFQAGKFGRGSGPDTGEAVVDSGETEEQAS